MPPSKPRRPPRVIPPSLHAAVRARLREVDPTTGQPYTQRAVAAWLRSEHGVRASRMSVCRLEAAASARGDELIVRALREEMRDAVEPAKRVLSRAVRHLGALILEETDVAKVATGVRAVTGALDTVAKLGGVAAPVSVDVTSGGQPLADAHAHLAAALARLAQEPDAGAAGDATRDAATGDG